MKAMVMHETNAPLVLEDLELDPPGPGELLLRIEAALAAHPEVGEAAVIVVAPPAPDPEDVQALVAALAALDPGTAAQLLREVSQA